MQYRSLPRFPVGESEQDHPADHQQGAHHFSRGYGFPEEDQPRQHSPDHRHGLVGIGQAQGKPLDHLLPAQGVGPQQQDHRPVAQDKPEGQEFFPGGQLAEHRAGGIQQQHSSDFGRPAPLTGSGPAGIIQKKGSRSNPGAFFSGRFSPAGFFN